MSELAQRLLTVIERGVTGFHALWGRVDDDVLFADMESALAELVDGGKVRQVDRWHFCVVDKEA